MDLQIPQEVWIIHRTPADFGEESWETPTYWSFARTFPFNPSHWHLLVLIGIGRERIGKEGVPSQVPGGLGVLLRLVGNHLFCTCWLQGRWWRDSPAEWFTELIKYFAVGSRICFLSSARTSSSPLEVPFPDTVLRYRFTVVLNLSLRIYTVPGTAWLVLA